MKCTTCGHDICDGCWKQRTQIAAERDWAVFSLEAASTDLAALALQQQEFERFLTWIEAAHPQVVSEYRKLGTS